MPLNAPVPLSAEEEEEQLCQALADSLRLEDAAAPAALRPPRHADVSDEVFLTPRSLRDDGPLEPESEPSGSEWGRPGEPGYPQGLPRLVAQRDLPAGAEIRFYALWSLQHAAGHRQLAGVHAGRGTAVYAGLLALNGGFGGIRWTRRASLEEACRAYRAEASIHGCPSEPWFYSWA
jgi:hypothetical protein